MPTSGALFGSSVTGPGSTHGAKHLVEQKAGRMHLKGKMVYPDKRKGMIYVYQSDDDALMHFCWKDRTTGVVEDDLIIFPDDCEYVKVPQCTTGRAYLLKFKSSNRRYFFWLQEPRTDKDEDNCKKINEFLNNPPGPGGVGGGSGGTGSSGGPDQDLQSLLNNMSQTQLLQLFGGVGQGLNNILGTMNKPSNTGSNSHPFSRSSTRSGNTSSTTPAAVTEDSQSASTVGGDTPLSSREKTATRPDTATPALLEVDLSTALNTEALSEIINNTENLTQLQEHLPEVDGSNQEQLRSTLQSPQFQQAVSMFSSALQSGQLAPVVEQFAVAPQAVAAARRGDMEAFVKALESNDAAKKEEAKKGDKPAPGTDKDKDNDEDEGMQLG